MYYKIVGLWYIAECCVNAMITQVVCICMYVWSHDIPLLIIVLQVYKSITLQQFVKSIFGLIREIYSPRNTCTYCCINKFIFGEWVCLLQVYCTLICCYVASHLKNQNSKFCSLVIIIYYYTGSSLHPVTTPSPHPPTTMTTTMSTTINTESMLYCILYCVLNLNSCL